MILVPSNIGSEPRRIPGGFSSKCAYNSTFAGGHLKKTKHIAFSKIEVQIENRTKKYKKKKTRGAVSKTARLVQ